MEMMIILALAFGAMWLMTNRTRKQQRKAGDFRANLEVGQEVMTGSGLYGTIVALDGDTITLESTPGNETRWIRAAISKLVEPPVVDEVVEADEDEADEDEADEYDDEATDEYVDDDAAEEYTADDAAEYTADDAADEYTADDAAGEDAADETADETSDDSVEVPDDLSSMPDLTKDDDTDKK